MGNDNSLTLRGCKEKLTTPVFVLQLSRDMKGAGLSRKRIMKKANILQTQRSIDNRLKFCTEILGKLTKRIVFLDESGFNLHTLINYGYSPISQDAILYQRASRERNISLCGLISISGIQHYKLVGGAFD